MIVGASVLLLVWAALYGAFQDWRGRHRALAAFGREVVAPTVDPLVQVGPADVDPIEWARAVADTHSMLVVVTGSGLLDRASLEALRDVLRRAVASARRETAIATLRSIWDDMEARAGPVLTRRSERPPRPPPRPAVITRKPPAEATR